ncbi:MAG TPA: PAS domain S-box protein [Armatimonadota bacterium]|nr:PAS domain S-box protein [Armatimonadota bacterium]
MGNEAGKAARLAETEQPPSTKRSGIPRGGRGLSEECPSRRLAYEQMLAAISSSAVSAEGMSAFQDECLRIIGETLDVSRAYILEYRSETDTVDNTFEWTAPRIKARKAHLQAIPVGSCPYWSELKAGHQVLTTSNMERIPSDLRRSVLHAQDVKAALGTPLYVSGELYGFMGFDECRQRREWPGEDVELLRTAARIISGVILRRRTEQALQKTTEMLQALVHASPVAIITLDRERNVELWNPQAERMFGWSGQEVIGRPLPIIPEDKEEEFRGNLARIIAGETLAGFEVRRWRKDGSPIDIRGSAAPLRGPNDDVVGVVAMLDDMTEYKQFEAGLRQSQKLEAVGRLAGGIAHEFKNLLMGISGYAEILQMKLGRDHPHFGITADLMNCVDRASKLISQLRTFSSRQRIDARLTDLNKLVAESQRLLERLLGEHISVVLDLAPYADIVNVDPGQIEQVLLNLAINARDAMPHGGWLTISTRHRRFEGTDKPDHLDVKPGEYAELAIADTGIGMDDATKDHIFEPFFTTKDPGESTGLGLAVTYGIVRQHKGCIDVSSELGKGTTFRVYLPAVKPAAAAGDGLTESSPSGGTETILLAEDEEVVREPVKSVLEGYGYTVLCASNGEEAIELFNGHADEVDLVILDLVMPKAGGKHIWRAMSERRADLKALFISGHSTVVVHQDFSPPPNMPFLSKPFSATELAARIRELLG